MDEASKMLTERSRHAASALGSRPVRELCSHNSWVLLGRKGAAAGSVPEHVSSDGSIGLEMWFTLDGPRLTNSFFDIVVESAGYEVRDASTAITVDGIRIGQTGRGLNVAVFDEQTGDLLETKVFDTHASRAHSDEIAKLVESQPNGRAVAVAVHDEATGSLTARGKSALSSLGGASASNALSYRQSWAFVGRKGATDNMTASAIVTSNDQTTKKSAPARATYRLFPKRLFQGAHGSNISLRSAGFGMGTAMIAVNGNESSFPSKCGLHVAVIDARSGTVTSVHVYDTHGDSTASDRFAEMIENLDTYTVVAVSVFDEATKKLNMRARRALRSLGSLLVDRLSYRASWVLVGVLGFAPGGSLEVELGNGPTGASIWLPHEKFRRPRLVLAIVAIGVVVFAVVANLYYHSKLPDPKLQNQPRKYVPLISYEPGKPKRRALLVSARTPSASQPELPERADRTVATHRRVLVNSKLFAEVEVILVSRRAESEATKTRVIAELRKLTKDALPGDVLLFVFLGHGTKDTTTSQERHCIKLWEDENRSNQVLLYDDEIVAALLPLHPDVNITCIFHACLSGGLVDTVPALTSRANRGIAITANDRDTPAYFDNGLIQGLTQELQVYARALAGDSGKKINSYNDMFRIVMQYIQDHHAKGYPQNPQLVNMTGNDGGKYQNLDNLLYLHSFA